MTSALSLDIGEISLEGASPRDAVRLRAVIEAALARVAGALADGPGPSPQVAGLGDIRLDLRDIRDLLAPGAETLVAARLEAAIRAAWEAAR